MFEYRDLPEDQRDIFHEYVSYAFSPQEGASEYDPEEDDDPGPGSRRGLYGDGPEPLCVCLHFWFEARVRGTIHLVPGLSAVASPPENRREGYVGRMIEGSLEEYRERGGRFAVLWPFDHGFYRRYGWAIANKYATYELDPEELAFAAAAVGTSGNYRRLTADDYAVLEPVYAEHAGRYALSLVRDEAWWRHRVFSSWTKDPFVCAWSRNGDLRGDDPRGDDPRGEDPQGDDLRGDDLRGYLVYTIDGESGDRTMNVKEIAFCDHEAYLALLAFCHNHDSQVSSVKLTGPEGSRLLDLVPDPHELDCTIHTGPMVRIVDVTEALAALSYPERDARVVIDVADPIADWNEGTFELVVKDGTASCDRIDDEPDASLDETDASVDVGSLSQLAVGYRSAADLEEAGDLEASTEALRDLDALFPRTDVYLGDVF